MPTGTPTSAPSTITAVALRSAFRHASGSSGAAATKSMTSSSAATSRGAGDAARQRHEDQRRAEAGKAARGARDESDGAERHRDGETDVLREEVRKAHPRNVPPVFFVTSATIFAATASISWSVSVFSRGWIVTAMPIDFLPSSMPLPS